MNLKDVPIKRKLMTVIMLTSSVVLFLTSGSFIIYEALTFRSSVLESSQAIAQITAASSTAALSFNDEKVGAEILSKLQAENTILQASLYDDQGKMLARYPLGLQATRFPKVPGKDGYQFKSGELDFFVPV